MDRPPRTAACAKARGFTLVEALAAIAIAVILLAWAVPPFYGMLQQNRMTAEVNRFVASLQHARSEAVRRGERVILCPSRNQAFCAGGADWGMGWIVFADRNRDRERGPGEPLLWAGGGLAHGIRMSTSGGRKRIRYQPSGSSGGANASFTFCDTAEIAAPRTICLSNTGRPRLVKTRCGGGAIHCD